MQKRLLKNSTYHHEEYPEQIKCTRMEKIPESFLSKIKNNIKMTTVVRTGNKIKDDHCHHMYLIECWKFKAEQSIKKQ
jgi:hypothetical protein